MVLVCSGDLGGDQRRVGDLEASVSGVGRHSIGSPGSESEACGCFPVVGEPAGCVEGVVGERVAPVGEDSSPSDRRELFGITHRDEPPSVDAHEVDEAGQIRGRGHARFIEENRGARGPGCRPTAMTGEEPGEAANDAPPSRTR